jgi:hypothetical protein
MAKDHLRLTSHSLFVPSEDSASSACRPPVSLGPRPPLSMGSSTGSVSMELQTDKARSGILNLYENHYNKTT